MSSSPDRRRRLASSPASAPPKGGSATPSGTSADDDPSSRCRPFHSPSRSHVQPLCCRFRARLPHSANVHRRTFAPLGLLLFRTRQYQTLTVRLLRQRLQHLRPEPGRAQRRVVHRDGSAAMSDNAAVTRALNAARARTCFDPSVRSPDRLGSRAPLQAHFWIGKDSGSREQSRRCRYRSSSDCSSTAGCCARTPVKSCTWWRHEVPAATRTLPGSSSRAAGSSRRSPICCEMSKCSRV